jgi:DNA polymerase-3 subunit delta'
MTWRELRGQPDVVEQLRRRFASGKIYGTFLFVGPAGVGKRTTAMLLAQSLLCQEGRHAEFEPCGACEDCTMFAAGTHPDLLIVEKPADKADIPLQLLIGDDEHRMREGLCHDIGLKPFRGGRRVAIVDDADHLNREGANCLLKTLEEPPPRSVMILIGTGAERQLPTIRSRSQIIRFQPLSVEEAARLIRQAGLADNDADAARLAAMSGGSLDRAERLANPAFMEFRRQLFDRVAQGWDGATVAKMLLAFVDETGKEAPAKRERLRWAFGFLVDLFRQVVHTAVGGEPSADAELQRAAERAASTAPGDVERLAAVIERCLEAGEQVDRNAHPNMLVEAFADDVERLFIAAAL